MTLSRIVSALSLLATACSSSVGGDIEPETNTSTNSTTSGTGGSGAPGTGGAAATGTGGADDGLDDTTAQWVMERLPGHWSNATQVDEEPSFRAKDLWVCELVAPEIGDRVVYLERGDPSADLPDVQLILDIEAVSPWYYLAVARVYVPEEPGDWVGLCDGAVEPRSPPSELRGLGEPCDRSFSYNDGAGSITISVLGGPGCVPNAPEGAVDAFSSMSLTYESLAWLDTFSLEGGGNESDPPGDPKSYTPYLFTRVPELR